MSCYRKAVLLPPQKEGGMGGDDGFTLYSYIAAELVFTEEGVS